MPAGTPSLPLPPRSPLRRPEAGFALLLVLWTLAFLALIGTQALMLGRASLNLESTALWKARLQTTADAAITTELYAVATGRTRPTGQWSSSPDATEFQIRTRSQIRRDRINPNIASQPLMAALLMTQGFPSDQAASLAATLLAWRSEGFHVADRASACVSQGLPFHDLDDLSAVPGMTPLLLEGLVPHLSFAQQELPDLHTGDPSVRQALLKSGISSGADQTDPNSEGNGGVLVSVDAIVFHGAFRMWRHAEVIMLPDERPIPWRLVRLETLTPESSSSRITDHS
ncbi:type II secretion system protein GspK [Gluconobacter kondonii]|uniref:type II secretion system protein GspK n=1 Tax=Gluconobacter kondonii TaxID=941463 RepID=UPI0020A07644|nr:type II secretion system protein GspK [Gluconobacter kondonii]MCP1236341.1 type II secretion system protein GspK [Gluconobacter kondonii]